MAISRMQEPRQLYGLGSLVKSIGKTIKKVVKSPVGKAALLGLGGYALGGGFGPGGFAFKNIPGFTGAKNLLMGSPLGFKTAGDSVARSGGIFNLAKKFMGSTAGQVGVGAALSALASSGMDQEEIAEIENDPEKLKMYLKDYYSKTNPDASGAEIEEFVRINSAIGGRVGLESGTPKKGLRSLSKEEMDKLIMQMPFKKRKEIYKRDGVEFDKPLGPKGTFNTGNPPKRYEVALGGIPGMPMGQMRMNKAGTIERDYRETGGFVPVGIKEKADDVPAMLSKNEFVMTADAVRGIGDGNIEKGAQRLYDQMKQAEKRVV